MVRYKQVEEIVHLMNYLYIKNTSTIAHVDHDKTKLSDSLLAAVGIISDKPLDRNFC
jgi:elongation factor 2